MMFVDFFLSFSVICLIVVVVVWVIFMLVFVDFVSDIMLKSGLEVIVCFRCCFEF